MISIHERISVIMPRHTLTYAWCINFDNTITCFNMHSTADENELKHYTTVSYTVADTILKIMIPCKIK